MVDICVPTVLVWTVLQVPPLVLLFSLADKSKFLNYPSYNVKQANWILKLWTCFYSEANCFRLHGTLNLPHYTGGIFRCHRFLQMVRSLRVQSDRPNVYWYPVSSLLGEILLFLSILMSIVVTFCSGRLFWTDFYWWIERGSLDSSISQNFQMPFTSFHFLCWNCDIGAFQSMNKSNCLAHKFQFGDSFWYKMNILWCLGFEVIFCFG